MTEYLEGDLRWIIISAIVELSFIATEQGDTSVETSREGQTIEGSLEFRQNAGAQDSTFPLESGSVDPGFPKA
jgi:hypothetical protein